MTTIEYIIKRFKINDFLELRLEKDTNNNRANTFVYVKNRVFRNCKFLLIKIPIEKLHSLNNIESIDEVSEKLGFQLEDTLRPDEVGLSSEDEFWAHCSNLHAWYEFNYDTRLLHSNLSFPLLKRLVDAGDINARQVFKEEIAKRLESGYLPVVAYLVIEGYLDYLSDGFLYSYINSNSSSFLKILFDAISSTEIANGYLAGLYLFDRIYPHLNENVIAQFTDIIKDNAENVNFILYEPGMLTPNSYTYIDDNRLHNVRLALILDMLKKKDFRQFALSEINLFDYLENNLKFYKFKEIADLKRSSSRKEWRKLKKSLFKEFGID